LAASFTKSGPTVPYSGPMHTAARRRLPFSRGFRLVLGLLADRQLLKGKRVAIDATTLEASTMRISDGGQRW
jgi:hypothetical protein